MSKTSFAVGLTLVLGLLSGSLPARAQVAQFDPVQLISQCSVQDCDQVLDNIFARLRASIADPLDLNSQIGLMAAVLVDAIGENPSLRTLELVARALTHLANLSSDPDQVASIIDVAGAVARGEVGLFDTLSPFAVSPDGLPAGAFRNPNFDDLFR